MSPYLGQGNPNPILPLFAILGAELVDSVLDVVRKEAESCDCLQVNYMQGYIFGEKKQFIFFHNLLYI